MDINAISIGPNPPKDLHAIIEIPLGGAPVKYELDKASGALRVDRFLHTAMFYPGNYGFIPHTLSADGDPCDVLVVSQVQVVPGAIVRCRPVGALLMEDEAGGDEKIIAVPVDALAPFYSNIRSYRDLPPIMCEQIAHFFQHYKDLEKGKWVTIVKWLDAKGTEKLVLDAIARAAKGQPGERLRKLPHQRQSGQQAADRKRDGKNDVERRKAKLAALIKQDGIERERREGGVAAEDPGGQEQPHVLWDAALEGEIADQQAHDHRACDVFEQRRVIEARPQQARTHEVDAMAERSADAAAEKYDQETHAAPPRSANKKPPCGGSRTDTYRSIAR
jgi:inorganic pyrophosphatase